MRSAPAIMSVSKMTWKLSQLSGWSRIRSTTPPTMIDPNATKRRACNQRSSWRSMRIRHL